MMETNGALPVLSSTDDKTRKFYTTKVKKSSQEVSDPSSHQLPHRKKLSSHQECLYDSLLCKFKCPFSVCLYSSSHKSNLKRHIVTMHESCKRVMKCCDQHFYTRLQYRDHIKTSHVNGFSCKLCQQFFVRRNILARHIDAIHGSLPHAHQCHKCSYSSSHKSNLKRHILVKHSGKEFSDCNIPFRKQNIWRPVPELFYSKQVPNQEMDTENKATTDLLSNSTLLHQVEEEPSQSNCTSAQSQIFCNKTFGGFTTLSNGVKESLPVEALPMNNCLLPTSQTQEVFTQETSFLSYLPKKLRISSRYRGASTLFS